MGRLDGKVALITGGARGMGKSHVRHFVAEGAQVVFGDVLDERGSAVAAGLGPEACRYLHHDVTSEEDWAAAVALAVEAFGHMDVLVNNAGILQFAAIADMALAAFRRVLEVNAAGCWLDMKAVIDPMTKVAARELARFGIRVNSVHPGGVVTRMIVDSMGSRDAGQGEAFLRAMPLARFAEPVEISRLVAYLASDESSYSTGSEFVADGGLLSGPGY